ncbi:MAG: rhodanese-like domain-containing protein [Spongiibacteraceae bacterium]
MAQFLTFLAEQWQYSVGLLVCVSLLFWNESKKGGPVISPQQLTNMVNQQQALVLDLRESKEFEQGHIVNAKNIPHAKLTSRMAELEAYRDKPIILVCKMGQHSSAAGKQLLAEGYNQVSRLSGGILEWQSLQLPLVSK